MIRGNRKSIIHIKDTESRIFDEAYFILKEGIALSVPKNDMINEANRIIEENLNGDGLRGGARDALNFKKLTLLLFTVAATVLAVLLFCLFYF